MREVLNQIYEPIVGKSKEIVAALNASLIGFKTTSGFFNGHYHKNADGQYRADWYPIAVIDVAGLCDVEIDYDRIFVTAKLSKEQAADFDWKVLGDVSFEVYGVKDYLNDCGGSEALDRICEAIAKSAEKEFFVSVSYPAHADAESIVKTVETLRSGGFYY